MTGLIDYAGLYPPASLDIKTTLANYGDYLAGEDGWMLGRCIVPADRLHQIGLHPGFRYSVIVSSALSGLELEQLSNFNKLQRRVEMVETLLPDSVDSSGRCSDYLRHVLSKLNRAELQDVQLFIETGSRAPAALLAASLAAFNTRRDGGQVIRNAGFKLRCGGTEQQAFPQSSRWPRQSVSAASTTSPSSLPPACIIPYARIPLSLRSGNTVFSIFSRPPCSPGLVTSPPTKELPASTRRPPAAFTSPGMVFPGRNMPSQPAKLNGCGRRG